MFFYLLIFFECLRQLKTFNCKEYFISFPSKFTVFFLIAFSNPDPDSGKYTDLQLCCFLGQAPQQPDSKGGSQQTNHNNKNNLNTNIKSKNNTNLTKDLSNLGRKAYNVNVQINKKDVKIGVFMQIDRILDICIEWIWILFVLRFGSEYGNEYYLFGQMTLKSVYI